MAQYIPSGVSETLGAINSFGQSTRANQALNMRKAQAQLNQLRELGVNMNKDPRYQKALGSLLSGGNTFATLFGVKEGVKPLTSSYAAGDTTEKKFGGQGKIDKAKTKESLLINQERLEELRGQRDKLQDSLQTKLGGAYDQMMSAVDPEELAGDAASSDLGKALAGKQNLLESRVEDIEKTSGLDKLNFMINETSQAARKDIQNLRKMGEKITTTQENLLTDEGRSFSKGTDNSARIIGSGTTTKQKEKIFGGIREDVEKFEKEKSDFLAAEKQRVQQIKEFGGELTGTETQKRAKVTKDYNTMMKKANSAMDIEKAYNNYVRDMTSIDQRYGRKSYYQPIQRVMPSLYQRRSASRGRGGYGGGGSFSNGFAFNNPATGKTEYFNEINAKNREDAVKKLKAHYANKLKNATSEEERNKYQLIIKNIRADKILGKEQAGAGGRYNYNTQSLKDFQMQGFADYKKLKTEKDKKTAFNTVYTENIAGLTDIGFNNTELKQAIAARLGVDEKKASSLAEKLDRPEIVKRFKQLNGISKEQGKKFMEQIIVMSQMKGVPAAVSYANKTNTGRIILPPTGK
jgi:hypothetical protein